MESLRFRQQILEMENNIRESELLNICTLCGNTTLGCDRDHDGVGWVQGWVHTECVEAIKRI